MWSTCSMSTGHWFTQAPHVVQDHSTSGSITPYAASSPISGRSSSLTAPSGACPASRGQDRRRRRHRVVAQVHDQQLRRERLLGVPRRALRLAAAALGAGREVEQALPGEVAGSTPTPSVASSSRSSMSSRVTGLPAEISGFTAPSATGSAAEEHVERRHEDVQVLGVQHEDQEDQHHADVEQQAEPLEELQAARAAARPGGCRRRSRRTRRCRRAGSPARTTRRGTGTSSR